MTTPPEKYLPEIPEANASGAIREIYSELRRLGAVPMAALIFRHLATMPGSLEWVWAAIGPEFRSGRLQEEAWRIAREAPLQPLVPIPMEVLGALQIDARGLREVRDVIDAYNRANPANLLAVTCLLRLLDGADGSETRAGRPWEPPQAVGKLVPMIDVATMSPELRDLFALLSRRSGEVDATVVPSPYRHFGHRPQFLALLITLILPRFDDGSIARAVAAIQTSMDATANQIVKGLSAPPAPNPGIGEALRRFGPVIPRMIVVGRLFERALPE
jgi:hypothetical protein